MQRTTNRRRALATESLESRTLLAWQILYEFAPEIDIVSSPQGYVVELPYGDHMVSVYARSDTATGITAWQLNFAFTDGDETTDNESIQLLDFQLAVDDFPLVLDDSLNSDIEDNLVASANLTDVPLGPGSKLLLGTMRLRLLSGVDDIELTTAGVTSHSATHILPEDGFDTTAANRFLLRPQPSIRLGTDDQLTVQEDQALGISITQDLLANDDDNVEFYDLFSPRVGNLEHIGDHLTYTPGTNFFGVDRFHYRVLRDNVVSNPIAATVNVQGVPDPPVAVNDEFNVPRQFASTLNLLRNDFDVDNETLSIINFTQPASGQLELASPQTVVYHADQDPPDTVEFSYQISDGTLTSEFADVSLRIAPNQAPVAQSDHFHSNGQQLIIPIATLLENDYDPEDGPLEFLGIAPPWSGMVLVHEDQIIYTPPNPRVERDRFEYTIADNTGMTATGQAFIYDDPPPPPPLVDDIFWTYQDGKGQLIDILGNDRQWLDFTLRPPTHGTVEAVFHHTLTNRFGVNYRPAPGFTGIDEFQYVVERQDGTHVGTVRVHVLPRDEFAIARADELTLNEDTATFFDPLANDENTRGDATVEFFPFFQQGQLHTVDDGRMLYIPPMDASFTETLTYYVDNGEYETSATVTVRVLPVNDPPLVASRRMEIFSGYVQLGDGVAADATHAQVTAGTAAFTAGALNADLLVQVGGLVGTEAFTYEAGGTIDQMVDATNLTEDRTGVRANNNAGVLEFTSSHPGWDAFVDVRVIQEDQHGTFEANLSGLRDSGTGPSNVVNVLQRIDNDDQELQLVDVAGASHGSTTFIANGEVTYIPDVDFVGIDQFEIRVRDGAGNESTGLVDVVVRPITQLIRPRDRIFTLHLNESLRRPVRDVISTSIGADGGVVDVLHGTAHLEGDELIFLPEQGYTGWARITLQTWSGLRSAFVFIEPPQLLVPRPQQEPTIQMFNGSRATGAGTENAVDRQAPRIVETLIDVPPLRPLLDDGPKSPAPRQARIARELEVQWSPRAVDAVFSQRAPAGARWAA